MKRIALVNQRCGDNVNGGSEAYTMQIAQKLSKYYNVDLITTTANDYYTWENYYKVGEEYSSGVRVLRFAVKRKRNTFLMKVCRKLLEILPIKVGFLENLWVEAQGPCCPDMIEYIKRKRDDYIAYIFVTYLYYHTVRGLPEVFDKAVLIPTAHDEFPIYYSIYRKIFEKAKGIGYLTEEEKRFTESLFSVKDKPNMIIGTGIEWNENTEFHSDIAFEYVIYVGRVDRSKGCEDMFAYFQMYKELYPGDLKLLLVGKVEMQLPESKDIISVGYVSEEEKHAYMSKAKILILPSKYESLSLSVLESMALGIPVLVNAKSKVLEAHCQKSKAGLTYITAEEFIGGLRWILNDFAMYTEMSRNARRYVNENYNWDITLSSLRTLIEL